MAQSTSAAQERLIRQLLQDEMSRLTDQIRLYPDSRSAVQHAAAYFLAAHAEVPSDGREAGGMIDALKSGGIMAWARRNQGWARPLLARLADRFGPDGSGLGAALMAATENARRIRPSGDLTDYEDLVLKPVLGL